MNLCDLPSIQALLERHGFRFSKSMGQNFLIDETIPQDIAAASRADKSCGVLEIGPGIGPLTAELAKQAGKVVSIELDKTLLPVLKETMAEFDNVEIISGDVMKLDLDALIEEKFQGLTPIVCANLPYNITTPVMTKLMETSALRSITVLVQKEAAKRLTAVTKDVGPLYWELQYRMETAYLFDVPADRFYPPPKVTSAVMRCVRRHAPAVRVEDEKFFLKVIAGAFLLRRKTLVNSLSSAFPKLDKAAILSAIEDCGLPPTVRGEALDLQDFAALSKALKG